VAVALRQLEATRFPGSFRQQVLHLRVDTAQLVVGPLFQRLEQFCVKAEKEFLFYVHGHRMAVKDLQEAQKRKKKSEKTGQLDRKDYIIIISQEYQKVKGQEAGDRCWVPGVRNPQVSIRNC
jgi:hypothetical protein